MAPQIDIAFIKDTDASSIVELDMSQEAKDAMIEAKKEANYVLKQHWQNTMMTGDMRRNDAQI